MIEMELKRYPITVAQNLLLTMLQGAKHKQVLNVCVSLLIKLDVDFDLLAQSVKEAIARDDSVRARFTKDENGKVEQYIVPPDDTPVRHEDFTQKSWEEAEGTLREWSRQPFPNRWDAPLCEIVTVAMPGGWNGIYIHTDHTICDSCAMIVLVCDIVELYASKVLGTPQPADRTSYLDSLLNDLERAKDPKRLAKDLAFWEKMVEADGEPLYSDIRGAGYTAPGKRWAYQEDKIQSVGQDTYVLEPQPAERLLEFCQEQGISLNNLLLMGLRTYLSKQCGGQKDISLRCYVSRRTSKLDRKAGGSRIHVYPCRTIMEPDITFLEGVRKITALQSRIFRHKDFDSLKVDQMLQEKWGAPANSWYQSISLTYQPFPMRLSDDRLNHIDYRFTWYDAGTEVLPIYLTVMHRPLGVGMDFYFRYQSALYSKEDIQKLYYYLMRILFTAVEDPEITIGEMIERV